MKKGTILASVVFAALLIGAGVAWSVQKFLGRKEIDSEPLAPSQAA